MLPSWVNNHLLRVVCVEGEIIVLTTGHSVPYTASVTLVVGPVTVVFIRKLHDTSVILLLCHSGHVK